MLLENKKMAETHIECNYCKVGEYPDVESVTTSSVSSVEDDEKFYFHALKIVNIDKWYNFKENRLDAELTPGCFSSMDSIVFIESLYRRDILVEIVKFEVKEL